MLIVHLVFAFGSEGHREAFFFLFWVYLKLIYFFFGSDSINNIYIILKI